MRMFVSIQTKIPGNGEQTKKRNLHVTYLARCDAMCCKFHACEIPLSKDDTIHHIAPDTLNFLPHCSLEGRFFPFPPVSCQ